MNPFEQKQIDWADSFSSPRNFIDMATDLLTTAELENFRRERIESNRRVLIQRIGDKETIDRLHGKIPQSGFATKFRDYLVLGQCTKDTFFAMPLVIHQRFELLSSPPMKEFSLDIQGYQTILIIEPTIVHYPESYDSHLIPNPGPSITTKPELIKSSPDEQPLTIEIYNRLRDNYEKAREDVHKRFLENTKLNQKQDWIVKGINSYKQAHFIKDSL